MQEDAASRGGECKVDLLALMVRWQVGCATGCFWGAWCGAKVCAGASNALKLHLQGLTSPLDQINDLCVCKFKEQ